MHGQAAGKIEFEESKTDGQPVWPESFNPAFVIARSKGALLSPLAELEKAKAEAATPRGIYLSFLVAIAAIPVVCEFLRMITIGRSLPFIGTFTWPIGAGLIYSVMQYGLMLAFIGVTAFVAHKLSGFFGGATDFVSSLKLIALALTPGCISGVLNLVPYVSILSLAFAIYGFYIFYIGIPVLTQVKNERRLGYLFSTIICSIVSGALLAFVVQGISPTAVHPKIELSGNSIELPGGDKVDISNFTREMEKLQKLVPQNAVGGSN